jgi:hypothetical protein
MQPHSKIATRSDNMRHLDPTEVSTAPVHLSIAAAGSTVPQMAVASMADRVAAAFTVALAAVASMVAVAPSAVAEAVATVAAAVVVAGEAITS